MSRLQEHLRTIPPATLSIIGLCCALYVIQIVTDFPLNAFTLCPRLVLYDHEYYRIVTGSVIHGGLMHIGMNMMSMSAVGSMVEKRLGTIRLIFTMLWSILLTSMLYIGAAFILFQAAGWENLMNQHSLGFSGVIFHLSVLECNLGTHQSRSVLGIFNVQSYLYPWVL